MTKTLHQAGIVLFSLLCAFSVHAQNNSSIRLIVPFNPGGGSDLFARIIAPGLSEALKQTVIVENRAGAGGIIGADYVAKSTPDGQTLLVSDSAAYSISPSLYPALPYAAKDLIPITEVARFANVLVVVGDSALNTIGDVIRIARQDPNKLTIASAGNGSSPHLTAEKFQRDANMKLTHVPYKGSGPAIADTLGRQVDMVFTGLPSVIEYLKSGRLKAIGIASLERSPYATDVPTMSEAGVAGFQSFISQGLFAPKGTPAEVILKLNQATNNFMNSKGLAERLQQLKVVPSAFTTAQYGAWLEEQTAIWGKLIKDASIKLE